MLKKRNQKQKYQPKNSRGHNITFLSGFPADYSDSGLHEITPAGLSEYIQNYTNWDLVGARMSGKMPYSVWDVIRYAFEVCGFLLLSFHCKKKKKKKLNRTAIMNHLIEISQLFSFIFFDLVLRCNVQRC